MNTKNRATIGMAYILAAVSALWPYLLPGINWYGRNLWDGFVAFAGGAFGDKQPLILYGMALIPVLALSSGVAVCLKKKKTTILLSSGTVASLAIFPIGSLLGISALLLLFKKSAHTTSASARRVASAYKNQK